MMKLDTPVGDPIGLTLTTPRNVVDDVHVVLLSGCKDSQESADVSDTTAFGLPKSAGPGGAGGACTNALLMTVHDDTPDDTWLSTLVTMRTWLEKNAYTQRPRVSCANASFDFRKPFSLLHPRCGNNPARVGRTRALFIGINYVSSECELDGAWNDVDKMRQFAVASGYKDDALSMRVLRDNGSDVSPTKANITKALRWLVKGAGRGDSLLLHFSGHGVSQKDTDAFTDEADGMDECLVPVDFVENGVVKDDDLFRTLVAPLAPGASLVAIMDCCHSGTMLDLGYDFTLTDKQFKHEKERLLKKVPLNGSVLGECKHAAAHFVPNTVKRAARFAVKTVDVACEGASEILQRVAMSVPLKGLRYGYDGVCKGVHKLTGWRVALGPADLNANRAVAGQVVLVGEYRAAKK
jgi:hypothetical protein